MKVLDKRATIHCSAVLDEESDEAFHQRIELTFRDVELRFVEHVFCDMTDVFVCLLNRATADDGRFGIFADRIAFSGDPIAHNGLKPHTHKGYNHKGGERLSKSEQALVDRITKEWESYNART